MHVRLNASSDIEQTNGCCKFASFFRLNVNVASVDMRRPDSVRAASQNGT